MKAVHFYSICAISGISFGIITCIFDEISYMLYKRESYFSMKYILYITIPILFFSDVKSIMIY